jgi:hypothetical protein
MVRGTAPNMTPDLRQIIDGVQSVLPDVEWEQLSVSRPADDDGLWFFWRHGLRKEDVRIESSSGSCPFRIETNRDAERRWGSTPAETVEQIVALLR